MGLPAFAAPLIAAGGSFLLNELFGGPSSQEQSLMSAGNQAAQAQAEAIRNRVRLQRELEQMIRDAAAGGRPPVFELGTRRGEGTNIHDFIAGIRPSAEMEHLFRLIGTGTGPTGAADSASALAAQLGRSRESDLAGIVEALLLGLDFGGGG